MKKIFIYLILIIMLPLGSSAQFIPKGSIIFDQARSYKQGEMVSLEATLETLGLDLGRQQMMTLTPVLRSFDRTRQIEFEPVVIMGNARRKAVKRAEALDGFRFDPEPSERIRFRRQNLDPVQFRLSVPYESWMRQAELVFFEDVTGCRDMELYQNQYPVISPVLPPAYRPSYQISYAEPPTEAVKQRSETYEARINFVVNRYEIRRDFMNNSAVLDSVDRIINEVKNDPNLTITEFRVTGYASPEGTAPHNLKLSENRARSFVAYVQNKHAISESAMKVDWKGDDWEGLRQLMERSNFSDRRRVLDILDNTTDVNQRKTQLRNMGAPYRVLLDEYYPLLRRNEYTIAYVARPFSVEEAKNMVKTKPQQLSLNEMYLAANTYPKNSREFKEVFDVAVRLYPDDPYANLNSAALDIENGAYDLALERSMKVNRPEAWNNIGYIYVQKGDHIRAAEYFKRAADAGLTAGRHNLDELNKWLLDQ